MKTVNI